MFHRPNRGFLLESLQDFAGDVARLLCSLEVSTIRQPSGLDTRLALEKARGRYRCVSIDR
jgi:hypothetical protein